VRRRDRFTMTDFPRQTRPRHKQRINQVLVVCGDKKKILGSRLSHRYSVPPDRHRIYQEMSAEPIRLQASIKLEFCSTGVSHCDVRTAFTDNWIVYWFFTLIGFIYFYLFIYFTFCLVLYGKLGWLLVSFWAYVKVSSTYCIVGN